MWSTTNYDYAKSLVLSNKAEYPYYIAVTNTNVSNNYVNDPIQFYVYLSKKPISASSRYNFSIPSGSVCYSVRSGSASSNYHSERVVSSSVSRTLTVDNYEFVYTNAEFESSTIQPDFLTTETVSSNTFNGVFIALFIVLLSVLFFRLIRS